MTQSRKPSSLMGPGLTLLISVWLSPVMISVLFISFSAAQVTIQNPQNLDIPEQRVQTLHRIICRVVAEEFHIREAKVEGAVTLVLGEEEQRTVVNELSATFHIYLNRWDEVAFAISDTELAVQRMLSRDRFERIAREVIRRVNKTAPVNANTVRGGRSTDSKSIGVVRPEPKRENKEPP